MPNAEDEIANTGHEHQGEDEKQKQKRREN